MFNHYQFAYQFSYQQSVQPIKAAKPLRVMPLYYDSANSLEKELNVAAHHVFKDAKVTSVEDLNNKVFKKLNKDSQIE